jgi:hypothetical protein
VADDSCGAAADHLRVLGDTAGGIDSVTESAVRRMGDGRASSLV